MIPLRATNYKLAESWPPAIIIHHSACRFPEVPELVLDKITFQSDKLHNINHKLRQGKETGFNFIVERVRNDFQVVASQPLLTQCEYLDLNEKYWRAVHICLMGNYNADIPMARLYTVLSYRILAPIMRLFVLKDSDILLHSTITNEKTTCPGEFIDMDRLLMSLRKVRRRKALIRRT